MAAYWEIAAHSAYDMLSMYKELHVGNDQEMAQSERNPHSINRGVGPKNKMTLRYFYQDNIS